MKSEIIYPELGEKTTVEIEYTTAWGGELYLITDLELSGRGIRKRGDGSDHKRGKKTYYATEFAFSKLKKKYSTCYIGIL